MTREEVLVDIEAGCPRFREWVRLQSGTYDDLSAKDCAFAQFLKAHGFRNPLVGGRAFYFNGATDDDGYTLSDKMYNAINSGKNTFEALAERLA